MLELEPSEPSTSSASANASQTDGKKRSYEGSDVSRSFKRSKPLTKQEKDIREHAERLSNAMDTLRTLFEKFSLKDDKTTLFINLSLPGVVARIQESYQRNAETLAVLQNTIPSLREDATYQSLEPWQQRAYAFAVVTVNEILATIAGIYSELLDDETYAPSASNYAQPSVWPEWQRKKKAILNLRPSHKQGLPISTLHPIFARFRVTLEQPPLEPAAFQTAHNLCITMADAFENEKTRRDAFKHCVQYLFAGYTFRYEVPIESKLELHTSTADLVLFRRDRKVLGGEFEGECGTGDAYMRISRVYQTWVNQLRAREADELSHGAPLILICVTGPLLVVAGGFFDGDSVLVEPLAPPCFMLPDYHHQRQSQLASVLLAIKEAVTSLSQLDYSTGVTFEPAVPRVYPSFTTFDGQTIDLTFTSRLVLRKEPNHELLFLATRADSLQQVLVKLVAGDQYGVDAHRTMANAHYAPILFGVAKVAGAHTAYVMEYLSRDDDWITLHESDDDIRACIMPLVNDILETMENENIVHGDLRPNNIMVREVGDELEMKLVDFDWAGTSGKVKYPFRRNETIFWPDGPGEPIVIAHDRTLLLSCLAGR